MVHNVIVIVHSHGLHCQGAASSAADFNPICNYGWDSAAEHNVGGLCIRIFVCVLHLIVLDEDNAPPWLTNQSEFYMRIISVYYLTTPAVASNWAVGGCCPSESTRQLARGPCASGGLRLWGGLWGRR